MSLLDFKILTKLGSGAYSSVYKVQRILDHQIYALKKVSITALNEKQRQNSLNQVRILASIRHPNIIGYRQAFFDQNTKSLCIIMEYADSGDLYQKITEKLSTQQFFSETQIWEIFVQIVRGLKALHQKHILHRDLKSANVFLLNNGKVKLGDMNVSKISQKGLCQTQTGTPYYASPEVWKDEPYGPKSDIWSIGCIIYEMMTLKPPFQAQDMEGLYKKVVRGEYQKLPLRYSSDLNDLVRILLQTDPYKRPSCQKILGMKMVLKRFNENNQQKTIENPQFLRTIRMPKNINVLTQNLPKPNYYSSKKQQLLERVERASDHSRQQKQQKDNKSNKTMKSQMQRLNKISTNQTQKITKKHSETPKSKILPKLSIKQGQNHNKSLILKNGTIIQAARNEIEIEPYQIKVHQNIIMREIKGREKRIKKQKTQQEQAENEKVRNVINMEEKVTQIQRIYGDNNSKVLKKKGL